MDNPDARNLFGNVELIFTFVERSAARHAYFIDKQFNPDQVPLHLIGLSKTRWNWNASSLRLVLNEVVFNSVIATIKYVSQTTSDGNVRGTAVGLLASISNLRFVISLALLTTMFSN